MNASHAASVQPSQIAEFLDGFIQEKGCIPADANPITTLQQLPRNLQRIAVRAPANEGWRAWTDNQGKCWFVRGKVSNTFSRRTARTAMHIFFHDADGELTNSGVWSQDNYGRWDPCDIPDARAGRRPSEN
jgi:hypothetical protein